MKSLSLFVRLALVLAGGPSSLAVAQTVYVVDQAGGVGSTHTTLGAAVAVAVDGDFVLVRDGSYSEALRLDGKGITVQAESGANVGVNGIVVENLSASQTAAIRGLAWNFAFAQFELTDNAGPVWIEDVAGPPDAWWTGRIERSANVVLRRCEWGSDSFFDDAGLPGLDVVASTLALYECELVGEEGAPGVGQGSAGGPGLRVQNSTVTIYASEVLGGVGGDAFTAGNGGPGVWVIASVVDVIGSTVRGGAGGMGYFDDGSDGANFQILSGQVNRLAGTPRILSAPSPLREGEQAAYTFTGLPGDLVGLLVAPQPGNIRPVRFATGPLVLPTGATFLKLGTLPATGTLSVTFQAPPVSAQARSFFLQGVFLRSTTFGTPRARSAQGGKPEIAIGTPTQLHVLDASF